MKRLFRPYLALLVMGSLLFTATSCSDDDPEPITEEQELITTLKITLVPEGKSQSVEGTYSDPDGEGGNDATANTLNLEANTVYNATIKLLDESKTPTVDLTGEVEEEGDEHELFYELLENLNLGITKTDIDKNNRPLGLKARIQTNGSSTGKLRITLKHQPGLKGNTSDITKGETDVQATFDVVVQ
ncbi:hypothetical protein [uncultured Pontibacter sp.]|uniref:hypothetical protein n=1 Tax=uncultured Pontibacter sp. TaxID=453356 RepID=UPI002610A5CC|nr:hypothetical protein [uncultured Pontibacter sp.]